MNTMLKISLKNVSWRWLCYGVLAILLILGTLHIFKSDLLYETDIARDFLLLEDMVIEQKLSFIGGRSSMQGVFHGPLYYWLLLPIFVFSGGSPVVVSFVWLVLYWLFLGSFYYVGKKTINSTFALISTTIIASLTTFYPAGITHTTVSNMLIIPCMFFAYQYLKKNKIVWLILAVITLGLLIQFQMAFGVPMTILFSGYFLYLIIKRRTFVHLLAFLVIALPLCTYLAFDLRHDFIQARSVVEHFNQNKSASINGYFNDRVVSMVDSFSVLLSRNKIIRDGASMLVALSMLFLVWKNTFVSKKTNQIVFLATFVILGFWIVTIPYEGNVWQPYYRPLLPVIVFCVTFILLNYVPKKVGILLITLIIGSNLFFTAKSGIHYFQTKPVDDEVHWKFYRKMSEDIIADSNGAQFGYYIFTPDLYGYQAKYAMHYFGSKHDVVAVPYKKQAITYLLIAPNPHATWVNKDDWQLNDVRISQDATRSWDYPGGYTVKRFDLSEEEIAVESNPDLVDGIQTR